MWAVAAQPRMGLTPMIPTPIVDWGRVESIWVATARCSLPGLEAECLVDEDDGGTAGHPFAVDDEQFVHAAVHAIRRLGTRVLKRERVLVDAALCLGEVGHDLLRAHHEDDLAGTSSVRSELAATGR